MAAHVGSRCASRSSAGSSNTGTRSSATPGARGPGCWRETLTHSVTPARASCSSAPAARALPRKSEGATRTNGGGWKTTDMEGAHASLSLEDEVSGAGSRQRPLEGKGGETPAAEEPGSLKNYAVFATRDVSAAPEKEEEEAEGPLRAQDLRESYIQLVQGVQEWQDGCMYQGEFGLNMKLGYGKFSWPTGESYHGQFYRDHCHGLGTYMWPDGSSFTGTFYLSHREGYGTMYMKTRLFQTHCHNDIVNLLLDCGADVNKCSDEGLTALSMCFLLHYPAQSFKPNVAERTIPEPQEPPKFPVVPILSSSFMDTNLESLYYEVNVPSQGSYELRPPPAPLLLPRVSGSHEGGHFQDTGQCGGSIDHRSSSLKGDSPLVKGSLGHVESGLEDVLGNTDRGSLCSAETKFESNVCVCDFSIELSQAMLERSAQSHSLLKMASPSPCTSSFDKGTMRRMALSMIERRKRWRTIKLLLRRGADPNLCCVPMQVLFLAVKAGDVDGVRLLLEHGARTDICFPPQLSTLTPLHIAAALPGEEGVQIVELLLHAITDVDAKASDEDDTYKPGKLDLLPSSLKLSNEPGPPQAYYSTDTALPEEGGRTALHMACEREDDNKVVKELLTQGADPNLPLTKGLGSALCVACDLTYEHQRNMDSKLALIDRLISHGADILKPVMLRQGEKEAVGTAVDYGYFRFFQDRRIARCPFHTLMPAERETFLARKRLLEYMGLQLRQAVFAKESQWDPTWLYLCKRAELIPSHRMKKKGPSLPRGLDVKEQGQIPFFKFCYQCGRSIGVRLLPCPRCYGILTCSKYCKTKAWTEFHKKDCGDLVAIVTQLEQVSRRREEFQ
ncbi:ankyrin repeat and MYND domain-containing protein 1 isoform 6 [Homo sapiens]|uniref:Ankyrin repeat and MYND domain containing 1 n=3 Tax=Homo sapiens TaxID=9606 RepID=J3KPY5_HUMAN|nr:ankyrin repeat and MYND domain-containing protein 1 isoform 6 [Homo sapiens]KAI2527719.1 ankyrin repeat and MYND domain containing 1 [Homo sapiens]|eukprot:NP_001295304.1 ankyrin repeat and MYND domain-containing protein 1 isoform 6 [Homo sapiens]